MNPKKLSVLSWNCRGLGNLDKCLVVRNVIKNSRCDVCCLQETKWNTFELHYFLSVFPSYLTALVLILRHKTHRVVVSLHGGKIT